MYRTHNCGEINSQYLDKEVTLSGWVQKSRNLGAMIFIDLRDRYGITQIVLEQGHKDYDKAQEIGREWVIQVEGTVRKREKPNTEMPTGEIEILLKNLNVLNPSETPPFTIEQNTDGGEELRMKYRYLDLRRAPLKRNLLLRNKVDMLVRNFLFENEFLNIETPFLIKSTPEGARDFVVPSRLNQGEYYALPQSPQTFKQLLMVSGYDRYFQIVRCFRDEDLRADRQPEFTQVDCEMTFVNQKDVRDIFEKLLKHLLKEIHQIDDKEPFAIMSYAESIEKYGNDKPDLRFDMQIKDLTTTIDKNKFPVFEQADYIGSLCVKGKADFTRKQIDKYVDWIKRPQIGMLGMIWAKKSIEGEIKSSVDKFYTKEEIENWLSEAQAQKGDILFILCGEKSKTQTALGALRLQLAKELDLIPKGVFKPLWIVDFPMFEWDEETQRYYSVHHPFTSALPEDISKIDTTPDQMRANAYDLVLNGQEIGGGSIRIHDQSVQEKVFKILGLSEEEMQQKFGFLLEAFKFGAPPHGGIALGFDRLVAILGGDEVIRDYIAFPKNNSGRDIMIQAPSPIDEAQKKELGLFKTMQ